MSLRLPIIIIRRDLCDVFISSYHAHQRSEPLNVDEIAFKIETSITKTTIVESAVRNIIFNSSRQPIISLIPVDNRKSIKGLYVTKFSGIGIYEIIDKPDSTEWIAVIETLDKFIKAYQQHERPGINVYTGPMYAGKSSALLKRNLECGYPVVQNVGRKAFDWSTRTHGGQEFTKTFFFDSIFPAELELTDTYNVIDLPQWKMYSEIVLSGGFCIDEMQFFNITDGDYTILDNMARHGIDIQIAILSGDFLREPWDGFGRIISMADNITHLKAKCYRCGLPAPFSKKVSGKRERIELDKDLYVPSCRVCYELFDN